MESGNRNKPPRFDDSGIPVLTDVVDRPDDPLKPGSDIDEAQLAILQTELASQTFNLAGQALHSAFQEMEAAMFERASIRLRKELPELIDTVLREYLKPRS